MKIAVYSDSAEWKRFAASCVRICEEAIQPLEVEVLGSERMFLKAVRQKHYDLVLVHDPEARGRSRGAFLKFLEGLLGGMTQADSECVWQFGRRTVALKEQEIYYISSWQKEISVHTATEEYRIRTTMKQEEARFSDSAFVRIHRNCLVNLAHIKQMEGNDVELDNGERLEISIRRKGQVRRRLLSFSGNFYASGKERTTPQESLTGAFGISECMLPVRRPDLHGK